MSKTLLIVEIPPEYFKVFNNVIAQIIQIIPADLNLERVDCSDSVNTHTHIKYANNTVKIKISGIAIFAGIIVTKEKPVSIGKKAINAKISIFMSFFKDLKKLF